MQRIQGGWSALAYKVGAEKQNFFLKVYEKHKHTAKEWICKIDDYMPMVMTLSENDRLHDKMAVPILTVDGKYKVENNDFVFILFPFVEGNTPGSDKLTKDEQRCLAEIVAELHSYKEADCLLLKNREDFNVNICGKLSQLISQKTFHDMDLYNAFTQYKECLLYSMAKMKRLGQHRTEQ